MARLIRVGDRVFDLEAMPAELACRLRLAVAEYFPGETDKSVGDGRLPYRTDWWSGVQTVQRGG